MGFDPQETLTQRDETCYVQDGVGIQIMELNPIGKKKAAEELMQRKREAAEDKCKKKYPESHRWHGNDFWPADADFRGVVLQNAALHNLMHVLIQELGVALVAHGGRIRISSFRGFLGLLRGTRCSAGGGRSSLAHGGGVGVEALAK
jgi:hypothetical protein